MRLKKLLDQCQGVNVRGERCQMRVHRKGWTHCRFHCDDPVLREFALQVHSDRLREYHRKRRILESFAALGTMGIGEADDKAA